MRKKFLSIVLAVSMLALCMPIMASAETDTKYGDYLYYQINYDKTSVMISDCETTATTVVIPSEINGLPVTSIGGSAFEDCVNLISIVIPDSVTNISGLYLKDCGSLESIEVSANNPNYTSLNGSLFNKDKSSIIKYAAGKSDAEYTVPNGVTSIGYMAFKDAVNLTNITIPDSVTDGLDFKDCRSLESIEVSANNPYYTSLDGNLFNKDKTVLIQYAAGKADTKYTIPDSVTRIGTYAFWECNSLTSIIIPDSVTYIDGWAFENCDSLTSVDIPNSVTSIDTFAFADCDSLTSVTLSNSVESIDRAFRDCRSLKSIEVDANNPYYTSLDGNLFSKDKSRIIQYAIGKSDTEYTIPNDVISIGWFAFYDCTNLTDIIIPDSIRAINENAFMGCSKLTDVYYSGTEAQWEAIHLWQYNDELANANIHYNYIIPNPDVVDTTSDTYEISEIAETASGVTFTVTTKESVSGKQAVIVARYDEDGVFLGLEWQQITASDEAQTMNFEIDKSNTKTVKAFVWNALGYMMPASYMQSLEL